jgi:hypothetical protein
VIWMLCAAAGAAARRPSVIAIAEGTLMFVRPFSFGACLTLVHRAAAVVHGGRGDPPAGTTPGESVGHRPVGGVKQCVHCSTPVSNAAYGL